jgi:pimeloyl-ACP methyl ester carboxylesterase
MPTASPTSPPPPPTSDELTAGVRVDIGGRALFIQCSNLAAPGPAVILEAGLAADHRTWAQVQPAVASSARVCSYDRAGLGQSDPGPLPRDAARAAQDLAALLAAARVSGPYVLVAHSFGGLFARRFAADNPDAIAGVVLVEAVHEDWWASALAALPPPTEGESERLRGFRDFLQGTVADPERNAEGVDIPASAAQAGAAGTLDSRPLVVLTAGVPDQLAPGLPPMVEADLVRLLQRDLPTELAALSSDSTQVVVPDSGHHIPAQRPDMVVLAIQAVLAAVHNNSR